MIKDKMINHFRQPHSINAFIVCRAGKIKTMSNQITLRVFSDYQLEKLKEMFAKHIVEKIGRVDEDGSLFIEYRGGVEWGDWDGVMKSKSIPVRPLENKDG